MGGPRAEEAARGWEGRGPGLRAADRHRPSQRTAGRHRLPQPGTAPAQP